MFSPEIVCSEEFLTMPISSQALYFHLGMRADDDGFVQPTMVMKLAGSTNDDLKVLLSKRFLLPFESGVVVIKHWLIHNMIRADRYKPTRFLEEKNSLFIKENKAYTDKPPIGLHSGNQPTSQVRLGKVSITGAPNVASESDFSEDDVVVETDEELVPTRDLRRKTKPPRKQHNAVFGLFGTYPPYWAVNRSIIDSANRLAQYKGLEKIKKALEFYRENKDEKFCPQINTPIDLEEKWDKLLAFKKRYD